MATAGYRRFDASSLLDAAQEHLAESDRLPWPPATTELLDLLYETGLYREEGRVPCGSFLLLPADATLNLLVEFSQKPSVSVDWLRKVGSAFDPWETAFVIEGSNDGLRVRGIVSRQVANFVSGHAFEWGAGCVVELRDVAELYVKNADGEAVFLKTACRRPATLIEVGTVIPPAYLLISSWDVQLRAGDLHRSLFTAEEQADWVVRADAPLLLGIAHGLGQSLLKLARSARRLGGGAGVLVTCAASLDELKCVDQANALKSAGDDWSGGLQESLACRAIDPADPPAPPPALKHPYTQHMLTSARMADDEVVRLCHATRIDGAVVLGPMLRPLGVGSKLLAEDAYPDLPPGVREFLESRKKGTRHKSIACATSRVSDSFGLVVSTDGDTTIFCRDGKGNLTVSEIAC